MKNSILVVAPHADDETLGCGGSILRYKELGYEIYWLLVTGMSFDSGYSADQIHNRKDEISKVSEAYGFKDTVELAYKPTMLDTVPKGQLIADISKVINSIKPEQIFVPYRNDAHSDHEAVYDGVLACTKTFRYPYVKRVLAYETISETDYGFKPEDGGFRPNVFIDVHEHLEKKLEIMAVFESEVGEFPFPRSYEAIKALAYVRGAQCNSKGAEAFMLIKEVL